MIVKNPTQEAIEIMFRGVSYRVDADGELAGVPSDAAEYWKLMVHNFIAVSPEGGEVAPAPAPVEEEAPAEEAEEVEAAEEAPEEEVEEAVEEEVVEEESPKAKKGKK